MCFGRTASNTSQTRGRGIVARTTAAQTHIGRALGRSPYMIALATALLVGALTIDVLIDVHTPRHLHIYRMTLAISAILCLMAMAYGDLASIGLVLRPRRGFRYWGIATAVIGASLILFLALICVFYRLAHIPPHFALTPVSALHMLPGWCLYYPLLEESLYRLVLCTPLVVLLGPWYAMAISGMAFGALHFLYGNPAPTNFVAGYILAWAYIRSDSILVPIVWHSLGNGAILAFQVGTWHLMR